MSIIARPIPPWDIPEISEAQMAEVAAGPSIAPLAGRVFQGRLNISDLPYMAKAILQISDENHELRERVRALEMVVQQIAGAHGIKAEKARRGM